MIVSVQFFYDKEKAKAGVIEPTVFKSDLIKIVDLGLHNAASDLVWLQAIQYFGEGENLTNKKLPEYLNVATDLDPKFSYPYAFGALVLPGIGFVDEGIIFAQKGLSEKIEDWRVPYYLATTYHINKNDVANAAIYFDIAANTKNVPDGIRKVAANYGSRADKREKTKQIWIGIYESSNDSIVRERARNYVIHFEILDLLENATAEYKKRFGEYPKNINDLVLKNFLKALPVDPFGFDYQFTPDGKVEIKD